jgi:hypothetical protein
MSKVDRFVIGFAGKIGAGKTTAAQHLVEKHGFERIRFAGPLKNMMKALGLTAEEIDGALKEQPCDLLGGKTPRRAMQTIGTEWGRDIIDDGLWIRAWRRAVEQTTPGAWIVVDDVRFPNEAKAIKEMGGVIVQVRRGPWEATPSHNNFTEAHPSERMEFLPDIVLVNDGDLEQLKRRVEDAMSCGLEKHWHWTPEATRV